MPSKIFHMVLVDNKKATGKCINMEKIHNLCDEIEGRTEKITMGFLKFHQNTMMMSLTCFSWYWIFSLGKKNFSVEIVLQRLYLVEEIAWYLKLKMLSKVLVS